MPSRRITLLGPQRHHPTIAAVAGEIAGEGPAAVITAGWQETEREVEELQHLPMPAVNLALYERSDLLFEKEPRLRAELWRRQAILDALHEAYCIQLAGTLDATRTLLSREDDDPSLISEILDHTIDIVRDVDARHLARVGAVREEFAAEQDYGNHPLIARHREEIAKILGKCSALLIAGGHVLVLLNRLHIFGIEEASKGLPIIAWSAGAMALSERIVLFHHRPPQGANNSALAAPGLGICPDILAFPNANRRLELGDPRRVSLLARRFAPALCVALEPQCRVDYDGASWRGNPCLQLTASGAVENLP